MFRNVCCGATWLLGLLTIGACGSDGASPPASQLAAGMSAVPNGGAGMVGAPAGATSTPPSITPSSGAGGAPGGGAGGRATPPQNSAGVTAPPVAGMPLAGMVANAGQGGAAGAPVAGAAGAAGAPRGEGTAMSCTGKPGAKSQTIRSSLGPSYIVHVPPNVDANKAIPLVIFPHGWTMSGALMESLSSMDRVSDEEGFIVVYPDGHGSNPWNVGQNACPPGSSVNNSGAKTFDYFREIAKTVSESTCINPKQIFVTGFSMGGYLSNNIGCQLGNEFVRAVGPHSGGTYNGDCPGAPLPIFIMHGDADTFISYASCGKGARDLWLKRNKCGSEFETKQVPGGSCDWYKGCDANGQTVFCSWRGVGHAWNGLDASKAVWAFFKAYL